MFACCPPRNTCLLSLDFLALLQAKNCQFFQSKQLIKFSIYLLSIQQKLMFYVSIFCTIGLTSFFRKLSFSSNLPSNLHQKLVPTYLFFYSSTTSSTHWQSFTFRAETTFFHIVFWFSFMPYIVNIILGQPAGRLIEVEDTIYEEQYSFYYEAYKVVETFRCSSNWVHRLLKNYNNVYVKDEIKYEEKEKKMQKLFKKSVWKRTGQNNQINTLLSSLQNNKQINCKMTKMISQNALPKNFAELLLNCEIEVELSEIVPKEIIMEILQLYSKGMEYFESIRSYKYLYFQKKMNSIMRSPKIIKSMTNKAESPKECNTQTSPSISTNQQEKLKVLQVKQKHDKMYNDYIGQTSVLTGDRIKKIVAENQIKLNEVKQSIKDQISEQERRLQLKIERRKFQNATKKSLSVCKMQKSTRDSLFSDNEPNSGQPIETDFTKVISQFEFDLEEQKIKLNKINIQGGGKRRDELNRRKEVYNRVAANQYQLSSLHQIKQDKQ